MNKAFKLFLTKYLPTRPPILLGLSGGPDSIALFYLLLQEQYPFEVAHIDHGWREESSQEASILEQLCAQHFVTFHLKKLIPPALQKNLEDEGRKARLAFFKKILETQCLKGLFLAHQADDQAETVLKRLFEGASLPKLKGLVPQSELMGMTVFRPLLPFRKEEILKWLADQKISYFQDPTNQNSQFLRARMRTAILPYLSEQFGKEIAPNLCRLGETAEELRQFLDVQIEPYRACIERSRQAISLNFAVNPPQSPFLWKLVIRDFFETQRVAISHFQVAAILNHLQNGSYNKQIQVGKYPVLIDRQKIILQLI